MKKLLVILSGLVLLLVFGCASAGPGATGAEGPMGERSEAELAPGQTDPNAMVFLRDTGHGTEGEEKVQRGIQTSDGGFLAIGVTDDPGGGFEIPERVDFSEMDRDAEAVLGFWMTVALLEVDGEGNVISAEPSEETRWEEFVFEEENYLWFFLEQYDPELIIESETSYELDESKGILTVEDPAFDGDEVIYGVVDGALYLQHGDIIRMLVGEEGGGGGGGTVEVPDRIEFSAMERNADLVLGFWMTVALVEVDEEGNVISAEPAEESRWEEFVFEEEDYLWVFLEQYDPGSVVESETSYQLDESAGTLTVDDPDVFDGDEVTYGVLDGALYLKHGDTIRVLTGEEGGGGGASDALVIKVDRDLNLVWQHRFGAEGRPDVGYAAIEIDDGYIVAGGSAYDGDHPQERWMAKLDKGDGSIIWEQHYLTDAFGYDNSPDFQADAIHELIQGENGNILATGYIAAEEFRFSFVNWGGSAFLMEIDPADGSVISEYVDIDRDPDMRLPTLMMGQAVVEADGGYYVAGDNGFIPEGNILAAVSFYGYDDAGNLNREFTSYIPGEVSAIDMTYGIDGGVVIVGHIQMEVNDPDEHGSWAPFKIAVTKLSRNPDPTPGENDQMIVDWQTFYHNPREFPMVDGDHYIRDEVWGVLTVHEADGYEHDGYVFVAGDGDETGDVEEESPVDPDMPNSSMWVSYVGYLFADGTKDWDEVYFTRQDLEDPGHEAGEFISTTDSGGFVIFADSDNHTDAPNAFGFTEIGPR